MKQNKNVVANRKVGDHFLLMAIKKSLFANIRNNDRCL